jgi:hypothetical protein
VKKYKVTVWRFMELVDSSIVEATWEGNAIDKSRFRRRYPHYRGYHIEAILSKEGS